MCRLLGCRVHSLSFSSLQDRACLIADNLYKFWYHVCLGEVNSPAKKNAWKKLESRDKSVFTYNLFLTELTASFTFLLSTFLDFTIAFTVSSIRVPKIPWLFPDLTRPKFYKSLEFGQYPDIPESLEKYQKFKALGLQLNIFKHSLTFPSLFLYSRHFLTFLDFSLTFPWLLELTF